MIILYFSIFQFLMYFIEIQRLRQTINNNSISTIEQCSYYLSQKNEFINKYLSAFENFHIHWWTVLKFKTHWTIILIWKYNFSSEIILLFRALNKWEPLIGWCGIGGYHSLSRYDFEELKNPFRENYRQTFSFLFFHWNLLNVIETILFISRLIIIITIGRVAF